MFSQMLQRGLATPLSKFSKTFLSFEPFLVKFSCSITPLVLIFCASFLTIKHHYGETVDCFGTRNTQPTHQNCWVRKINISRYDSEPGGENYENYLQKEYFNLAGDDKFSNSLAYGHGRHLRKYYPWIYLTFLAQVISLVIIGYHWRNYNDRSIVSVVRKVKKLNFNEESGRQRVFSQLSNVLPRADPYFFRMVLYEVVCFIAILIQTWFLDWSLEDSRYAVGFCSIVKFFAGVGKHQGQNIVPGYPTLLTCTNMKAGGFSAVDNVEAVCLLPNNAISKSALAMIRLWFGSFLCVAFLWIGFRSCFMYCMKARRVMFHYCTRGVPLKAVTILSETEHGIWFVMTHLAHYTPPDFFILMIETIFTKAPNSENPASSEEPPDEDVIGQDNFDNATSADNPPEPRSLDDDTNSELQPDDDELKCILRSKRPIL